MRTFYAALLLCFVMGPPAAHAAPANAIVDWNRVLLETAEAEDGFLTLKGLRTAAMMHLAMHDALNAVDGRYDTYLPDISIGDADPFAVAMHAAYAIAVSQYPHGQPRFLATHNNWFEHGDKANAQALGERIAEAVLESRAGDGWDTEAEYQWHPMAPGVYAEFSKHSGTPEGFVFGAGWARARGFALTEPDQFRSPPPPAIDSDEYAAAFDEVKALGRFQSMERTPDQAHLALWWKDFVENSHNRLARDLVSKEQLDVVDTARLFALLNMSIFDAYVSSFDNKFHYNHWRPYTAIRWAANDGNPATDAEETWTNLHRHTYAFPSYPSAHGTACGAAMTVMADSFGASYPFEMRIPLVDVAGPFSGKVEMHPPTRSFDSFGDAAIECGASRVYLGIHFRYDSVAGVDLGNLVGQNVVDNLLLDKR